MSEKRQKSQLVLAFMAEDRGEAPRDAEEGTESFVAKRRTESLAIGEELMEEVCERENGKQALARVKSNKGSAGVDGMTVEQLPEHLKQHWPAIREQLLSRDVQTAAGEEGRDSEAGRWDAKAWHSDGAGSVCAAGGDAGTATQVGSDVF